MNIGFRVAIAGTVLALLSCFIQESSRSRVGLLNVLAGIGLLSALLGVFAGIIIW